MPLNHSVAQLLKKQLNVMKQPFKRSQTKLNQHVIVQLDVMKMIFSKTSLRWTSIWLESNAHDYLTEKLKKRLTNHFGDLIELWGPSFRNEEEFIFANTVEKGQIIEDGVSAVTTASATVPMGVTRTLVKMM